MKKPAFIITYVVLAIVTVLAILYFIESRSLKSELELSKHKISLDSAKYEGFNQLYAIDSLLLKGSYSDALRAYEQQLYAGDKHNPVVKMRIQLAQRLITQRRQLNTTDSTQSDTENDSIQITELFVTPEEIRNYDSISFALDKANLQLKNLQQQIKQKSKGEYLTFTTSKGNKVHYVGEVKDNMANGSGVALLSTGSRYTGEWKNNLRHGTGTFYWPDGEYYEGAYKDDKRHGTGTYFWPNGERFTGGWANDHRNGEGIFYGKDGEVVASGTWKNDELVNVDKN